MIGKIFLVLLFIILIPNAYAQVQTISSVGKVQVEYAEYEIKSHEQTLVKISGKINDIVGDQRINIAITFPSGLTDGLHTSPTSDGYFETFWILDKKSPIGEYKVLASYENAQIGQVIFQVKEKEFTEDELLSAREMLSKIKSEKESKETTPETLTKASTTNKISIPVGTSAPGCELQNKCYIPYAISIASGTTVTWTNDDTAAHTVTGGSPSEGKSGEFDSSLFMAGGTFSHKFSELGTFDYFCMVHPWMVGTIIVQNNSNTVNDIERKITIDIDDHSITYPFENNNKIKTLIEIENYSPSDGDYSMKITHVSSKKIIDNFKIFPKYSGNNKWVAESTYSILNSDIRVNGKPLLGTYLIQISSENNPTTATAKFSILESRSHSLLESKTDSSEIVVVPKVIQPTSKVVEKSHNPIQKDNSSSDNNVLILIIVGIIITIVVIIIIIKIRNQSDDDSTINHFDADNYDTEENVHDERLDWK